MLYVCDDSEKDWPGPWTRPLTNQRLLLLFALLLYAQIIFFFSFSRASAFMRENAIVSNHLKQEEIQPPPPS